MSPCVGDIESMPLIFTPVRGRTQVPPLALFCNLPFFPRAFFPPRELTCICNHVNVSNLAVGRIDIHGIRIFMQ